MTSRFGFAPVALALFTFALVTGPLQAAPSAPRPASGWPQAASDIAADPDIRFGLLPNGMRYAVRRQATPPGQAALRLWFDAGSMQETDAQKGLAHFLEHMAFNGSKRVPEGEMIKILERLGLAFGADTNASTGFSETIYQLDLPRTDDETVNTALMLLGETAFNLTIDPAAVDRERGIILSEERARNSPRYNAFVERLAFLLKGQRLPQRLPIGDVAILKTTPASEIVDYYRAWYRPERAVFVAVGDFDVDRMVAGIEATFGGWRAQAPARPDPDPGALARRTAEARVMVDPGLPASIQMVWVAPFRDLPDTVDTRRSDLIESLGMSVLNRRFSGLAREANPPFLSAAVGRFEQERSAELVWLGIDAESGRWAEALAAAEREQRRLARYGVRQDELDREIEETRAGLKARVAGAATRRPADLAQEILGSLSEREVITSPAQDLAAFEAAVAGLRAETVNRQLSGLFKGQDPLIFVTSPKAIDGGEAAVLAALETSRKVAVTPPTVTARVAWPYASFGPAGAVSSRRTVADLGVTFVTFANGARLTIKPTDYRDDEVLVRVNIGEGMRSLPADRQSPYWAAGALVEGGLGKIDVEDMERALASRVYGARFSVTDDAFVFSGSTRPQDLDTQLQVLGAYIADPAWRETAFARLKASARTVHDQYEATDGGVFARDLPGLTHSGDRRWTFPSREDMAGAAFSDLRGAVEGPLRRGALEAVIVGDVEIEATIRAVAATLGALPTRAEPVKGPPPGPLVRFPGGRADPVVLTHKGRADQASAQIAWATTDFWADPQRARETAVLREVVRLRITERLREALGVTYSPDANSQHSLTWTGWGFISASIQAPPDKLDSFFTEVAAIAADLRTREVDADELARARAPRVELLQKARLTNGYWSNELSGAQADPRRLDAIRDLIPGTAKVTAADIRRVAQTWLAPERAWKVVSVPAR
ncbi:M16 family metallopeptidase [Phenylobacterium sp.]|jgi:zinc protease|uniref:M16 family metallopeptidase n=1 Tax=Phenylobacterium sp. TaxID=1871053 RepID=UPI0037C9907A